MPANIENKAVRLQLQKQKVWDKGIDVTKKLLVKWIKSRSYEKLKSGNSISTSR